MASVALIVEIADATLRTDLGVKAKIYAAHGVPEYWVADVNERSIIQMWLPNADGYAQWRAVAFGSDISCEAIDSLIVKTATLGG